jgi:hypothetical protein
VSNEIIPDCNCPQCSAAWCRSIRATTTRYLKYYRRCMCSAKFTLLLKFVYGHSIHRALSIYIEFNRYMLYAPCGRCENYNCAYNSRMRHADHASPKCILNLVHVEHLLVPAHVCPRVSFFRKECVRYLQQTIELKSLHVGSKIRTKTTLHTIPYAQKYTHIVHHAVLDSTRWSGDQVPSPRAGTHMYSSSSYLELALHHLSVWALGP